MFKVLFTTWFILKSYSIDDGKYVLLLEEPEHNYHLTAVIDEPLSELYKENTWIKVKSWADCQLIETPYTFGPSTWTINEYLCTANTFEVLECTEENSWVIYGTRYC